MTCVVCSEKQKEMLNTSALGSEFSYTITMQQPEFSCAEIKIEGAANRNRSHAQSMQMDPKMGRDSSSAGLRERLYQ